MARNEHPGCSGRGKAKGRPGPTHPVRLNISNVQFDDNCLDAEVQVCAAYIIIIIIIMLVY